MFNVPNIDHKNHIAVLMKKKSLLDLVLTKKNDSRSHTHVEIHVQISGELRWDFCTNNGQFY